jgi:sortase A
MARTLRTISWSSLIGALAVVGCVAWQLWGTAAYEARSQDRLMAEFEQALGRGAEKPTTSTASVVAAPAASAEQFPMGPALANEAPSPPRGSAVAVLRIPRLGLEKAVVEGVRAQDLKKGPGHYPETPLPGRPGNSAIAGHRTTYGAPFNHLDELEAGDDIWVTTLTGRYHYVVNDSSVTRPSDVSWLRSTEDNRLTLTTCHPEFSARKRFVVVATLVGEPDPLPTNAATVVAAPSTTSSTPGETTSTVSPPSSSQSATSATTRPTTTSATPPTTTSTTSTTVSTPPAPQDGELTLGAGDVTTVTLRVAAGSDPVAGCFLDSRGAVTSAAFGSGARLSVTISNSPTACRATIADAGMGGAETVAFTYWASDSAGHVSTVGADQVVHVTAN